MRPEPGWDWLTRKVDATPDQEFLVAGDEKLTYSQVASLVSVRAGELGDRQGTQVLVAPRLEVDSVVELLAVGRSGATMVVIGPDRPDGDQLIRLAAHDPRAAHTILFTSGSSGSAKGVRLSESNWRAAAEASMKHLGHGAGDRWLAALPLHHVGGLSILYRSLYAGGTVVLASDLDQAGAWLDRVAITSLVPTQLYRLLQRRTDVFGSAPTVLLGGGPADPVLVERAGDAGLKVLRTYGMTETTSQAATARDPGGPMFPLPGVEVAINSDGRICISGPIVMSGYLGETDLTGGFVTSDRGVMNADGSLEVLGRSDRVIITGGEKVDPGMVEALVARHPGIAEVAVVGVPDPEWGERVVGVYVGQVDTGEVEALLRSVLPSYACPKQWLQVEGLPRTDLGKVDAAGVIRLFSTGQSRFDEPA